jgi:hypothetical protein
MEVEEWEAVGSFGIQRSRGEFRLRLDRARRMLDGLESTLFLSLTDHEANEQVRVLDDLPDVRPGIKALRFSRMDAAGEEIGEVVLYFTHQQAFAIKHLVSAHLVGSEYYEEPE